MMFSDVPIGARFKSKFKATFIKFAESNNEEPNCLDISAYNLWFTLPETEVELVTKCVNCKHWVDKPRHEHGEINYCHEVSISHIDEENFPCVKLADPETFSCSLFEMKD